VYLNCWRKEFVFTYAESEHDVEIEKTVSITATIIKNDITIKVWNPKKLNIPAQIIAEVYDKVKKFV
jgi:hypothetical protein